MENRNWDEFKFWGHRYNSKYEQNFYQEYLQPSLFIDIYSTYTDSEAWLGTYHKVLDLIGDSIQYHNSGSRIRDREKAFERYPLLLENPKEKYISRVMGDYYGKGNCAIGKKPAFTGGVGCAEINIWQHKFTKESWQKRIETSFSLISCFKIRIPVDQFADEQAFLNWVLPLDLLQSPTLFSATAGYRIEHYEGHQDPDARKKFEAILDEHPGFESGNIGNVLGDMHSEEHKLLKPQLSRINWLNALSEDAFLFFPGGRVGMWNAAQKWPELALHDLPHGFMVQAGEEPSIGDNGKAPEAYYSAGKLLETFSRHLSPRELQFLDYPEWALQFYTPERLEKFNAEAIKRASAYIE